MRSTFLCLLVASAASPALAQDLVTNGSFELPVVTAPWVQRLPGVTFGGWTVDQTGQGIAQVGSFGNPVPVVGSQCLELNFNTPGGVSQTLTTEVGRVYLLSFLLAGQLNAGPDLKSMRIDWDGAPLTTVTWSRSGTGGQWVAHDFEVVATATSTVLHFFGLNNVDGGPYLDAVSVVRAPCRPDTNQDGNVDQDDVGYLINVIGGGENPTGIDPDFNEDGNADQDDITALIDRIAGGPCP